MRLARAWATDFAQADEGVESLPRAQIAIEIEVERGPAVAFFATQPGTTPVHSGEGVASILHYPGPRCEAPRAPMVLHFGQRLETSRLELVA